MKNAYPFCAAPSKWLVLLVVGLLALAPAALQAAPPLKLEAEKAIVHGPHTLTATLGYSGTGYAGNFENATDSLTFSFTAAPGWYELAVRYSAPFGPKDYQLAVNGQRSGYSLAGPVAGFADSQVGRFRLQAGKNTITLARGWGYFGIDYLTLTPALAARLTATIPLVNGRAEVELGTLTGVQAATTPTGFSGTGFVTGFDAAGDNVSMQFDMPAAGLYKISIGYTSPFGDKNCDLEINGDKSSAKLMQNTAFGTAEAGTYWLPQGLNTVIVKQGWGYFGIDYLQLTATSAPLPAAVATPPTDAQATPGARALLTYLRSLYGTKMLAGQHAGAEDRLGDMQYILTNTGKEPALGSFDLIEYSPTRMANGSNPTGYSERYMAWAQQGNGRGIVSLMWHWNAPTDLINSTTNPWWRGFYTDGSTFNIETTLADPAGARYQLLLRDIDAIAVQLKKFQDAGIPVLWRPLHEAEGGWFWWGAKGAGPYKALWQLLYNRLTTVHKLHNLIWVYGGIQNTSPAWYPGDAYVDIAGVDLYLPPSANMSGDWTGLQSQVGGRKLAALTESGNLPDPDKVRAYATWWSWFTIWSGKDYIKGQLLSLLQRVYTDPDVITRDELPNWLGTVSASLATHAAGPADLAVFPNPATGYSLNASLTLAAAQTVAIILTNTLGQPVAQLPARLQAGANTFQLPISGLRSGMYLLTVQGEGLPMLSKRVLIQQ